MPGKRITDHQVHKYKQHRNKLSQVASAAKAGISERSARRLEEAQSLPSQRPERSWRTREDPLSAVWDSEVIPLLQTDARLNAVTLLEELQRRYPGQWDSRVLRTLQRRIRLWRAKFGVEREVYFAQEHPPGRQGISDFTVADELNVEIAGMAFTHRLYQFALAYSGVVADRPMGWTPPPKAASQCAKVEVFTNPLEQTGASDMKVTTLGIDLAKNVFEVHGIDQHGKVMLKKQLKRAQMAPFFINLPPCLVGIEACGSAHHWARKLQAMGHTVRLMAPQFVKPYVKTNKNDAADAEAICEAVGRPNMRFVPIKNVEQQAVLALHRVRQGFVKARTAQGNQIRGLLAEFGIIVPQGISNIALRVPELIEDASNELPGAFRVLVQRLLDHLKELDRQAEELEAQLQTWHRNSELSTKIAQVPGIGPISASALVASIGDATNFDSGRQLAAWLGLVPKQHSTGGKSNLLSISKRGDTYLRTLLIHGARSVIYHAAKKPESCTWVSAVMRRRNKNLAAVALANKNARIVWALLAHNRRYEASYTRAVEAT